MTEKSKWKPLDMRNTLLKMVDLKFSCLHCLKHQNKNIKIDFSDILSRFNHIGMTYDLTKKPSKK